MSHTHLPLVDLPNHSARQYIATVGDGPLLEYYRYKLAIVPNSAVDILWHLLGHPGDVIRFSKLVMLFVVAGTVGATMLLARVAHGRWTAWSAASAFFALNSSFIWGFQNYVVSIPFVLLALALWLKVESRSIGLRLAVFLPVASILFVMHLFGFLALAIAAFGREVHLLIAARGARRGHLARMVGSSLPFVLPMVWLALQTSSRTAGHTEFGSPLLRIHAVVSSVGGLDPAAPALFSLAGLSFLALLMLGILSLRRAQGPRLIVQPSLAGPVIALAAASLLAPVWLYDISLVHIRLPFVTGLIFVAATDWRGLKRQHVAFAGIMLAALLVIRTIDLERAVARHDSEMRDLAVAIADLPAGARLLSVRSAIELEGDPVRRNVPAYAVIWRGAFVPSLFQGFHSLRVRQEWVRLTQRFGILPAATRLYEADRGLVSPVFPYVADWRTDFTHVLLIDGEVPEAAADAELIEIGRQGRFVLYAIGTATGSGL